MSLRPKSSYVVWHTQRTGSTLLCTTLERTNLAGRPEEWPEALKERIRNGADAESIRDDVWLRQTTANGVFGVKFGYYQPFIDAFFAAFGTDKTPNRKAVWETVFPDCRHIVMTRRDKVRLAVSWWKSISGGPGHLSADGAPLPWQEDTPSAPADLEKRYEFDAIQALVLECVSREAAIQDLLEDLEVTPLTVTYEDSLANYEQTVRQVLVHIGVESTGIEIPAPMLARTSDDVNERWVQRFRTDLEERRRARDTT